MQSLTRLLNANLNLDLPKDPRTIMSTPRNLTVTPLDDNGSYWHQGLTFCLQKALNDIPQSMTISLNINIDGLPIYKSSTKSFWPILFNIQEIPGIQPLVIGIYYGGAKPKDAGQYLKPFIEELVELLEHGLQINDKRITVKVRCFICDTPARAFIKGVINFNGKYGCIKCTTKGTYSHISRTMVFPDCSAPLRTDELFRAKAYPDHQRYDSPLTKLPINMIEDVIVADSLHLLELGVMKKLLTGWRTGNMTMKTKWSTFEKTQISKMLISVELPKEIHRRMRSLDHVSLWKGLEYRNFLNYVGIVILKDFLPEKYFTHFLMLFCAVRICSVERYSNLLHIARSLMNDFLIDFKALYGIEFMTSNIHNLCHLVDEVTRFGPLPTISAYPFENSLHSVKKMIKTGPNPLAQIAGRISEAMQFIDFADIEPNLFLKSANGRQAFVNANDTTESKLVLEQFMLTDNFKDKWILTNDNHIIAFTKVVKKQSGYFIQGQTVSSKHNYFEKPFKSAFLHIYIAKLFFSETALIDIDTIFCKLVAIPRVEGIVFAPLMHTIE